MSSGTQVNYKNMTTSTSPTILIRYLLLGAKALCRVILANLLS